MFVDLPLWAHGLVMLASIAALAFGASWFVEGASRLAARLDVSELVIGLTVVAFGTSAPELAVSVIGALRGQGDIAVGNVVGSNIFNLGFILGGCALIRPLRTSPVLLWKDGLVLAGATVLLLVLVGYDLELGRAEGALLFGLLLTYLAWVFRRRRGGQDAPEGGGPDAAASSPSASWWLLALGLAGVVLGAQVLVGSATTVARGLGISEWTIGVTVIAAGTSMPELATSLAAVLKRNHALGIGSLIGSDLFNILGVLGVAALLHPVGTDVAARGSLVAMAAMVLLVLVSMRTGWRLSRVEGFVLVSVAALRWGLDLSTAGLGS